MLLSSLFKWGRSPHHNFEYQLNLTSGTGDLLPKLTYPELCSHMLITGSNLDKKYDFLTELLSQHTKQGGSWLFLDSVPADVATTTQETMVSMLPVELPQGALTPMAYGADTEALQPILHKWIKHSRSKAIYGHIYPNEAEKMDRVLAFQNTSALLFHLLDTLAQDKKRHHPLIVSVSRIERVLTHQTLSILGRLNGNVAIVGSLEYPRDPDIQLSTSMMATGIYHHFGLTANVLNVKDRPARVVLRKGPPVD